MRRDIRREIRRIIGGQIKSNVSLSGYTSFHVGGPAECIADVGGVDSLRKLLEFAVKNSINYFMLGCGTNILPSDSGLKGIVIKLKGEFEKFEISGTSVVAGSAVKLNDLLKKTMDNDLSGIEFMSGIPGSIGGAVVTNAGTADGKMEDVLEWVELMEKSGRVKRVPKESIRFSYRKSYIPAGEVITAVGLKLGNSKKSDIIKRIERVKQSRINQPGGFSAGSVFKNPKGNMTAGQLIEGAGLKCKAIGGAVISKEHANFIINKGGATSKDIRKLIKLARETVRKKYGVNLKPEIRILEG